MMRRGHDAAGPYHRRVGGLLYIGSLDRRVGCGARRRQR
jgi:hypothetical protein